MLPISTNLSTRSGCWVAIRSAMAPPKLLPTRCVFSMPSASISPTVWSAHVSSAVLDVLRPVRVAEADHVRGDDAEVLGQRRDHQPPVRVGGDARTRAVDQQDGLAHRNRPPDSWSGSRWRPHVWPISGFSVVVIAVPSPRGYGRSSHRRVGSATSVTSQPGVRGSATGQASVVVAEDQIGDTARLRLALDLVGQAVDGLGAALQLPSPRANSTCMRIRLPTFSGAGKRTLFRP